MTGEQEARTREKILTLRGLLVATLRAVDDVLRDFPAPGSAVTVTTEKPLYLGDNDG